MRVPASAQNTTWGTIWWILLLAGSGFAMSFLGAGMARLTRDAMVLAYLVIVGALLLVYVRSTGVPLRETLFRRWRVGLLAGLALGALLTLNVLAQPGSPTPSGLHLVWNLLWLGVLYGIVDALLLNVLPGWIVGSGPAHEVADRPLLRHASTALGASLLVTAAYHLGYHEFRGPALIQPLIGNALLTLGFLITQSPASAMVGHVIMHAAAVLHGMETTVQLPPHY